MPCPPACMCGCVREVRACSAVRVRGCTCMCSSALSTRRFKAQQEANEVRRGQDSRPLVVDGSLAEECHNFLHLQVGYVHVVNTSDSVSSPHTCVCCSRAQNHLLDFVSRAPAARSLVLACTHDQPKFWQPLPALCVHLERCVDKPRAVCENDLALG